LQAPATAAEPAAEEPEDVQDHEGDGNEDEAGRDEGNQEEHGEQNADEHNNQEDKDSNEEKQETCNHEPRPKPVKPVATLAEMAERRVLGQLTKDVTIKRVTARYCCGGRVGISPPENLPLQDENSAKGSPLTLRWDDSEDGSGRKINFPNNDSPTSEFHAGVGVLADNCKATGFLDESHFSINFDPQFHGVLDIIAQILVPVSNIQRTLPKYHGVRAKLLNLQASLICLPDRTLPGWEVLI
jgi:hypothetical protein